MYARFSSSSKMIKVWMGRSWRGGSATIVLPNDEMLMNHQRPWQSRKHLCEEKPFHQTGEQSAKK